MSAAGAHVLIPGAAFVDARGQPCAFALPPNLKRMLEPMRPVDSVACELASPATPWELVQARLLGLPDEPGRIPWAAYDTQTPATPCAWVLPCHWSVGREGVRMDDPLLLRLEEAESRALMEAAAPWFAEDRIALRFHDARRWLATGEVFRGLPTVSLDRAVGRDVHAAQFGGDAGRLLARLQNEMQMLFYTHPVNEARESAGRTTVNSFWIKGAGVLETLPAPRPEVAVEHRLRAAARQRDAAAHAAAWAEVDADLCARLLAELRAGQPLRVTLGGDRSAQTWDTAGVGAWQRFQRRIGLRSAPDMGFAL